MSTARRCAAIPLLVAIAAATASPASQAEYSSGSPQQVAWVRRAASNFVHAELRGDGSGACAVLVARLRASRHHRTCARRWDVQLASTLRDAGTRARLRRDARAIPSAVVLVHGSLASIALPAALLDGASRFRWTENCWMLEP